MDSYRSGETLRRLCCRQGYHEHDGQGCAVVVVLDHDRRSPPLLLVAAGKGQVDPVNLAERFVNGL